MLREAVTFEPSYIVNMQYLKVVPPKIVLGACMIDFGLVTMLQGFATSYGNLLACRSFLGAIEAGVYP